VIDADLAQRVEEPLREPGGVALAVARGEAVPRVTVSVGDVEIADVAEADDAGSRRGTASSPFVVAPALAGATLSGYANGGC